jgi:hypothetical protein
MEDGYKNREVTSRRYESALSILTDAERNEYLRDGYITLQEQVDLCSRRAVEEKMTTRHETRKHGLEEILQADFYAVDTASDGVPFTHFVNIDYGLVSIIRFSDGTIHVFCKDERYFSYLHKRLCGCFELEKHDGFVRINICNPLTVEDKINKIKQQLNS